MFRKLQVKGTFHHLINLLHIQDLSFRPLMTRMRYMWYKVNGEIRLWEFGLDNNGVLRCLWDEMIRPPFQN
jgi:hypothetical protein